MFHFSDFKKYRSDKMNPNDLNGMKDWSSACESSYNPMDHRQVHLNQNPPINYSHHAQHNQQHMPYMSQQPIRNQSYQGCNSIQLNPNAEIFVPRGSYQQTQYNDYYSNNSQHAFGNNQQSYFQNYSSNNMASYDNDEAAYEAMYGYGQFGCDTSSALFIPSPDLRYLIQESKNSLELNEIQVGLEQLISDDDFDSWSGAIKERMTCANMTTESRVLAIKIACEMATAVSPDLTRGTAPQFTFARLLAYLSDEVPEFMSTCILPTIESLHSNRITRDIQGKGILLMFFAELFVNLRTTKGGTFNPLGQAVFDQMDDIVKDSVCNETMSVLIQVLKLSGCELDSIDAGQEQMNQILTKLNGYVNGHRQLSETIKARISDVIETRQRGWNKAGRSGTGSSTSSCVSAPPGSFIGPDGKVIDFTEEERMFLEQQFADMDKNNRAEEPNIDMNDVMDEFGKFVHEEKLLKQTDKAAELLGTLSIQKGKDEEEVKEQADEKKSDIVSENIPAGIQEEAETDKTN